MNENRLAAMKADELWRRREKGRHERKATVLVMLLKKLKHDKLEKFCVRPESNGCGNGVGRTGSVVGMVGRDDDVGEDSAVDVEDVVEGLVEDVNDEPDVKVEDAVSSAVALASAGIGCRL